MKFTATVHVSLKQSILDPQGRTIERSLHNLGYDTVRTVRTGKTFTVAMQGERAEVERQLASFAGDVLSNPVIEDVSFELAEAAD